MRSSATVNKNGISRRVVRHRVRQRVQEMILSGRCRGGSKLVQQELARELGVAQGVVREALLELQACGLVETVDNRGMFVSRLNAEKLLESYDVREVHEGLAARLCCDRITRRQVRALRETAERISSLAGEGKFDEMASADRDLHQRIIQIAGNSSLIRLAENYCVLGKIVRGNRDPYVVREEHLAILQAIEDGRGDDAERVMREHIRAGKRAIEEQLARGEFVPQWVA